MPDSAARSAFPKILKRYMDRDNLTQIDIANSLKVSKQTVSDWVSGKKFPRVDRMQQLANLFGVLMSEMYTHTEDSPQDFGISKDALTPDDRALLDAYHGTDPITQANIRKLLGLPEKDTEQSAI